MGKIGLFAQRTRTRFLSAAFACAATACMIVPGSAFALEVNGVDSHASGEAITGGTIEVLEVIGNPGDRIWVDVLDGDLTIAKNIPYTLPGDDTVGVVSLDIDGDRFDLAKLETGAYTVQAWEERSHSADDEPLAEVQVWGVYGDLEGKTDSVLIGTQTQDVTYKAPSTLYVESTYYELEGAADQAHHYTYKKRSAGSVEGRIHYIDGDGNEVSTQNVGSIAQGATKAVEIPAVVKDSEGTAYRTVNVGFENPVTLANPDATEIDVRCVKAPEGWSYQGIVLMVANDEVIARDSFEVNGAFTYTAPLYIYKTASDGSVDTYKRTDPAQVVYGDSETVVDSTVTKRVAYAKQPADAASTDVTFVQIDGSGSHARLGTETKTVSDSNKTATPSNISGYKIAGAAADYAYTFRSGQVPVVNVYYLPDGYTSEDDYTVTVNYVNYRNGRVLDSSTFNSSAGDGGTVAITSPERFTQGGTTYVRLNGQQNMVHNYYSGTTTYTVYYYDNSQPLPTGGVETVRVVYDGTTTTTTTPAPAAAATPAAGAGTQTQGAGAGAATTTIDDDATPLASGDTYTTVNGGGNTNTNGTLNTNEGVDTGSERIVDDKTPLAQSESTSAPQDAEGVNPAIIAAIIALLLGGVGAGFVWMRKRNQEQQA